ncbi:MAG: glycoside hydrolase family 88 protein [Bacteroidales bacterium]|nr:glycoside hydrolase family 88 protein [Bacteroidales bacterium]
MAELTGRVMERASIQFAILDHHLQDGEFPRSYDDGRYIDSPEGWWCSGFFPGSLWYVYEATSDESVKEMALRQTHRLDNLVELYTDHDIGFQVNSSFGNAYRLTGDESLLPVIEAASAKLAKRFNPTVGCIRSWDHNWYNYPVIIDNMMNLELLLNASDLFACDSLAQIARTHADVTMKNHFRGDFSSYHLVDYLPLTGEIDHKQTVQGFAHESAWSRGQSWGLYGYTMMYEKTGDEKYLSQAENIARFLLPMMPEDGIPYWDFNAPGTPDASEDNAAGHPSKYFWREGEKIQRDASAGAIMASAFVALSALTKDSKLSSECRAMSEKAIRTLASPMYFAEVDEQGGFLIKHCVGNMQGLSEIDVPLTYADYYFLEAIVRFNRM